MYLTAFHLCLGNTINPRGLQIMIKKAMDKRQKHILGKKNLTIQVDSELAKLSKSHIQYQVSHNLFYTFDSASNGRSHLMLNTVKRDERRANKSLFKKLLAEHEMISDMKEEVSKLRDELKRCQVDKEEADKNKEILANLYDKQVIDDFGNLK